MKTNLTNQLHKLCFVLCCCVLLSFPGFAQNHVSISMQNCVWTSNTIEFDMFIVNDGSSSLQLGANGWGINFASNILNGSPLSSSAFVFLTGTQDPALSGLPAFSASTGNGSSASVKQIKVSTSVQNQGGSPLIDGPQLRLGRFMYVNLANNWLTNGTPNFFFLASTVAGTASTSAQVYVNGSTTATVLSNQGGAAATISTSICDPALILNPTGGTCAVTLTGTATAPTCLGLNNGTITLTAGGNTGGFPGSYRVGGGPLINYPGNPVVLTGLAAGTYNITFYDDGGAGALSGQALQGVCSKSAVVIVPAGVSPNDNNPCTTDACSSITGLPTNTPLATINDNNACTTDACNTTNGSVTHVPLAGINDNDVCTTDICNTVSGSITHTPPATLNDNNACTTDACNSINGSITHTPLSGINDNDACTTDACDSNNGSITHTSLNVTDGNACTNDVCDPAAGTTSHNPITGIDDNDACTTDACDSNTGSITHTASASITDGNACTDDVCDPATGTTSHNPITGINDNDACTTDACDSNTGSITHTTATNIDDGNVCTTDVCDSSTGTTSHTPLNNTGGGDTDNNACTSDDCSGGTTVHNPLSGINDNNVCTDDACDSSTGSITHTPIAGIEDNNACTTDACTSGPANVISNTFTESNATGFPIVITTASGSNGSATLPVSSFPAGSSITGITATVNMAHTWGGDLEVVLTAPNGTTKTWLMNNWSSDPHLTLGTAGTTPTLPYLFANGPSAMPGATATPASPGSYSPVSGPLASNIPTPFNFNGLDPNGNWTLNVVDHWGSDGGQVDGLSLTITADFASGDPVPVITHTPLTAINDGNACTDDACNSTDGSITHTPLTTIDDGNPCTDDVCNTSVGSTSHNPVNVDDLNGCTDDACNTTTGSITHTLIDVNDNNACTTDDCVQEVVTQTFSGATGLPLTWEDVVGNGTTPSAPNFDVASLSVSGFPTGSFLVDLTATMDINHTWGGDIVMILQSPGGQQALITNGPDANFNYGVGGLPPALPYTFANGGAALPSGGDVDVASPGPYAPFTPFAYSPVNPNGVWLLGMRDNVIGDGGTIDNLQLTLTVNQPKITHTPITGIDDSNACTDDACDSSTGSITHTALTTISDGNACTDDACDSSNGSITHTAIAAINDNNACTDDACDSSNGSVTHTAISGIDDSNACTDDACDSTKGSITHTPLLAIDDRSACTDDACDSSNGSITHTPIAGIDDSNACTDDACNTLSGSITHTPLASINDNNACTDDACDSSNGSVTHTAIAGIDDSNACTNDACNSSNGSITHTPLASINDNNACTDDACDSSNGSVTHTPLAGIDDSNACTNDACNSTNGSITHTPLASINDNNACTDDACDSSNGSVTHTPLAGIDDSNACTNDACNSTNGSITHTPLASINDNNACTDDACDSSNGSVTHTALAAINDNNACTNDACNPANGSITHTPLAGINDNDACTTDACDSSNGSITHTPLAAINDGNACTNDACNPANGSITHTAIAGINDNDACTTDACDSSNGSITHTPLAAINDGNACTNDACNPANGSITHTPIAGINDGVACTDDACDSATGSITHTDNPVVPTATAGAILCNGGYSSVTVTATGGQGSYTGTGVINNTYQANTYTISVTDARGCTGTTSITITEPTKVTVTVDPVVCSGNFGTATAVPSGGTGAYTYLWGPATLTTQTTNPATNLGNGVYTVRVTDANGCSATSSAFTVTCTVGCPVIGPITGPLYVCKGQTVTYCVPAVSGGYTYVWTLPSGMTAVGATNGNCITVSVGSHLSSSGGYICVKSSCVGSNQVCFQVKQAKNPNTPGTISGPSTLCPGTCATYSVAAVQYAASYVWSASAGLTITSYQGTNSVLVCASASYTGGGSVSVKARNCKKDSGTRTKSNIGAGNAISWQASNSSENATVACAGSTVAYEVSSPGTGGCVTFSAPAGAVIRDRRGNASNPLTITQPDPNEGEWEVDVQFPAGFVSGNVTATPCGGPCGPGTPITLAVRSTPAAPTVITGSSSVCKHSTVCYSIPAAAGATSYTWSITPTNTGIQVYNGQGTTNVCIKYNNSNTASATLNVKANNSCGSSATISKPITINLGCKVSPDASGIDAGLTGVLSSLNAYPNPTTGKAAVTFNSDRAAKYTLKVVDMIGKVMISESISAVEGYNMKEINLENVAKGLYLISVQTEGSEAQTLRLVVE